MALDIYSGNPPIAPPQKIPDEVYRLMYELGYALINDDKRDLFRTVYKHRPNYKYHGKVAKHHESPLHHWQGGTVLVLVSMLGMLMNTAMEAQEVAKDFDVGIEGEDHGESENNGIEL